MKAADELRALISVEDFGLAVTRQSVLQCLGPQGRLIVIDSRHDRTRGTPSPYCAQIWIYLVARLGLVVRGRRYSASV